MAQLVKNLPAMQETWVPSLGWEDPLEGEELPIPLFQGASLMGFPEGLPCGASLIAQLVKNPPAIQETPV